MFAAMRKLLLIPLIVLLGALVPMALVFTASAGAPAGALPRAVVENQLEEPVTRGEARAAFREVHGALVGAAKKLEALEKRIKELENANVER